MFHSQNSPHMIYFQNQQSWSKRCQPIRNLAPDSLLIDDWHLPRTQSKLLRLLQDWSWTQSNTLSALQWSNIHHPKFCRGFSSPPYRMILVISTKSPNPYQNTGSALCISSSTIAKARTLFIRLNILQKTHWIYHYSRHSHNSTDQPDPSFLYAYITSIYATQGSFLIKTYNIQLIKIPI